jgi:aminoglycoside phosphotransferase (APT) family kinase protein
LAVGELRRLVQKAVPEVVDVSFDQHLLHRFRDFFFLTVTVTDGDRLRPERVVVSWSKSGDAGHSWRVLAHLYDVGFCPPAVEQVPRPWGELPGLGIVVQGRAEGRPWVDLVTGRRLDAAASVARWLVRLHGSPPLPAVGRPNGEADAVLGWTQSLAARFPSRAPALVAWGDRVTCALASDADEPVPTHGDFHAKNVHVDGPMVTVFDFDDYGLREPATDVGHAIAQLLNTSRLRCGSLETGASSALAFIEAYLAGRPLRWDRVAAQIGRALVQNLHYELCLYATGNLDLLEAWPALADAVLNSDGPDVLTRLRLP